MTDTSKKLIDPEDFRVSPGKKVKLKNWPTCVNPYTPRRSGIRKSWMTM